MVTRTHNGSKVDDLSRLIFLASELHLAMPQAIIRNLDQGELIQTVASEGIHGAASTFEVSLQHLESLRFTGSTAGPATEAEFRSLVVKKAVANLENNRLDTPMPRYMGMMKQITDFFFLESNNLIDNAEVTLDVIHDGNIEDVARFNSGFEPFDLITGGFYQGIFMMTGKTGHGKTTAMLAIMKYLRENDLVSEQIFYETEIPLKMMKYKLRHIKNVFTSRDILRCGHCNLDVIIEQVKGSPDPDRVIYIDSPDVIAGGTGEGKRFYLESIYRKLVTLKDLSKMVVVASQAKQKGNEIELESASDSFDKTRYTDGMIGWRRLRTLPDGYSTIKANMPKNRFGLPDQSIVFDFNYNTFDYRIADGGRDDIVEGIQEDDEDW